MSVETVLRGSERTEACTRFLFTEAHLLDHRQFDAWLQLLASDIVYEVPVRTVTIGGIDEYSTQAFYLKENYDSIEARVMRFHTDYAWAEDPPTKTRHCVSNVFVEAEDGNEFVVRSNLLLLRYRMGQASPDMLSAERIDRLRVTADGLKLGRRTAYIDASVLGMHNLAVFL